MSGLQDAVRGDYMEVAALLQKNGGKVPSYCVKPACVRMTVSDSPKGAQCVMELQQLGMDL
jgi:hypothetical protein